MDNHLERIYLDQIIEDCDMFKISIQKFNETLQQKESDPFIHATAAIQKAAAVSRMFWPPYTRNEISRARAAVRGEKLRSSLNLNDQHPIKCRALRDHLEHFDERLDDWAERSKTGSLIKRYIGPTPKWQGIERSDIVHHFDPGSAHYYFRGQAFDLQSIANGIMDISERVTKRLELLDTPKC